MTSRIGPQRLQWDLFAIDRWGSVPRLDLNTKYGYMSAHWISATLSPWHAKVGVAGRTVSGFICEGLSLVGRIGGRRILKAEVK